MRARSALLGVLWLGTLAAPASAQTWQTVTAFRERHGERALRVKVEYGAGEFSIRPGAPGGLYRLQMRYDADRIETVREFREREGVATLRVGVEGSGRFSLRGMKKEGLGSLDLELARDVPTELDLHFGAVEAQLDLGGMHLTALTIETGASNSRITFREPNATTIPRCRFKAGAAAFRVEGLGNARCERVSFEGGVGDVLLDFGGAHTTDPNVEIRVGVGSLTLRVPETIGVAIEKQSFLAWFHTPRMSRKDDRWVSDNWDRASRRLTVSVKAALGSVSVAWTGT